MKNEIVQELQDMHSPLAGASRVMPYPVPEEYFEALTGQLITTVENAALNTNKEQVYELVASYFDEFPDRVLAAAQAEEIITKFPRHNPLELPGNYFDTLPASILHKIAQEKTGAITIKWRQAIRWAAAAILIMGIALGSYKFFAPHPVNATKALAALPDETIQEYLVQNIDDFDTELILNNLNTDKDIRSAGLADEDIIQYLNETGWGPQTEVN